MPRAAVVVSTYNNPRLLELCLTSLIHQSERNFVLHIADDGSEAGTEDVIARLSPKFLHRPLHHWHPDEGYRKALINNTVFRTLGDFDVVILVDGDTIEHEKFVEDHLSMHDKKRTLFMGRRIDLGPEISGSITPASVQEIQRGLSWPLLKSWWTGETKNLSRALRISAPLLQSLFRRGRVRDLLGSNFSICRELLWEINGYDEEFEGYWGEDGDLFVRARNSGARILGLKSFAIQFHLFHKRLVPTKAHEENYQRQLQDPSYRHCEAGIFKK
jgi:glycosyltransferase involved in cell wall biosynthesis